MNRFVIIAMNGDGVCKSYQTLGAAIQHCEEMPGRAYVYDRAAQMTVHRNYSDNLHDTYAPIERYDV